MKSVVYRTIYSGTLLPPYYIGSTTSEIYNNGYFGSPSSRKWKNIFKKEFKEHPERFTKEIIEECESRELALQRELYFQKKYNVVKSAEYYNEAFAFGDMTQFQDFGNTNVKGRKWYNNGIKSKMFVPGTAPIDWELGRCSADKSAMKDGNSKITRKWEWYHNPKTVTRNI